MKIKNSQKGFTVLETIISITILGAVIAGVSNVVSTNLRALSLAKEEVKAFYLAQEAIEMIKNKRDGNELDALIGGGNNWLTGFADLATDPCYPGSTCRADAYLNTFTACGVAWGTCAPLRQDQVITSPTYLLHSYDGSWSPTAFTREIQVENISATEIAVTIQISWNHGGTAKSFKTKTTLNNWF